MIACVFVPDMVALVERTNGRSTNKQIILIDPVGKVQAASLKAVQYGVRLGMRYRQAKVLCLDADVLVFEERPYREMSEVIISMLAEFADRIEPTAAFWQVTEKSKRQASLHPSAGIYYLDLGKLRGSDAHSLAVKIIKILKGSLQCSVAIGLAADKFTAHVAARYATLERPRLINLGEEATFLSAHPLTLLPLDKETSRRLKLLGLYTLGDFAALPSGAVFAQLGKQGRILQDLARGVDKRPVLPPPIKPVEYITQLFDGAIEDKLQIEMALGLIGCEIERRLQTRGYALRTIKLQFNLDNGGVLNTDYTCRRPTSNGQVIGRLLISLFSRLEMTSGIVSIQVNTGELMPLVWEQLELFGAQQTAEHRLQEMVENLVARFGGSSFLQMNSAYRNHRLIERRFRLSEAEAI